jgi:UDP-N-acetylglucosamine diphosphorylase/glucosamine-1-phosphate N-acetyltransferase
MTIVLFDHEDIRANLLPFTYTRPVSGIRCGILTIREKWERMLQTETVILCTESLGKYLNTPLPKGPKLYINSAILPDKNIIDILTNLQDSEGLQDENILLAYKSTENLDTESLSKKDLFRFSEYYGEVDLILNSWDIFKMNAAQIRADFQQITEGRESHPISDPHTKVYNEGNVFVEAGAQIKAAVINAEKGPVYIGKNSHIEEGAIIRGSFALCEGAFVNTGAKIRGDSTIGPYSKVGGEVSNSVVFGFSNKGHDGFLGNSVIGEWCNIGADTNTSNLKNNYDQVKLWNYRIGRFEKTGEQFCGLMMGDHSKCGINTMFNTGTVVGVGANIFGAGFPANFIPSFFWGGPQSKATFSLDKMLETAEIVMARRNQKLDENSKDILEMVFRESKKYRPWD